jgi:hypothetical protein
MAFVQFIMHHPLPLSYLHFPNTVLSSLPFMYRLVEEFASSESAYYCFATFELACCVL